MDDTALNASWSHRHAVMFNVAVSFNYHRKRQRFFDLADKITKAATVLAGASLLGEPVRQHLPLAAGAITGLGLLSLVFSYGDRKQAHKELAEAFMHLQAQIEQVGRSDFTDVQLAGWQADLARLCSREPPTLRALVTICHNEQAIATGQLDHVHPLPWHHRLLANWFSFSATA